MASCLSFIPRYLSPISLFSAVTTKALAETTIYVFKHASREPINYLATAGCITSIGAQVFEKILSPDHLKDQSQFMKYHIKTSLLIFGSACIGFGIYEGLHGSVFLYNQMNTLAEMSQLSSTIFNSLSFSLSGVSKILIGKNMIQNGIKV